MTPERMILLILKSDGGLIRGKTLLQKRAYFLSILLEQENLGFHPHYYGPYSPIIQGTLDKLKATGFIEERMQGFDASSPFPIEARRYDYALTVDGEKVVTALNVKYPEETDEVLQNLRRLKEAGDNGDYRILSIAAKTYHIIASDDKTYNTTEIRKSAVELGWEITDDQIRHAADFLEKLGLISPA